MVIYNYYILKLTLSMVRGEIIMQYIAYIFIAFVSFFIFSAIAQDFGAGVISAIIIYISMIIIEKLNDIIKLLEKKDK